MPISPFLSSQSSMALKRLLELIELDRTGERPMTASEQNFLSMIVDWHRAGS